VALGLALPPHFRGLLVVRLRYLPPLRVRRLVLPQAQLRVLPLELPLELPLVQVVRVSRRYRLLPNKPLPTSCRSSRFFRQRKMRWRVKICSSLVWT
jgi:hypothetical protein